MRQLLRAVPENRPQIWGAGAAYAAADDKPGWNAPNLGTGAAPRESHVELQSAKVYGGSRRLAWRLEGVWRLLK